ncbi:MAG: DoxX family protein [Gammaproteobacteria bacterium]
MIGILNFFQNLLDKTRALDFLAPLALRLYLVPVFWMAGTKKLNNAGLDCLSGTSGACDFSPKQDIINWFGNAEWGLGLPFPEVLAYLASYTEYFGAILLLIGLAVRWIAIPLMVTMVVAMVTVHLQNGWLAIAEGTGVFATARTEGAIERLDAARGILQEHGNYSWLTENGSFVVLNNGIEFAATYFIMLLALFFMGAGRHFSVDAWIAGKWRR